MATVSYKYYKSYRGKISGASVQLDINKNERDSNEVIIDVEKVPFTSQGFPEGGLACWIQSAKAALTKAIEMIPEGEHYTITVKQLLGRQFIDTNNAAIGVACMLALFQHLEISLSDEQLEKLHQFVSDDWKNDVDTIPDFGNIFS